MKEIEEVMKFLESLNNQIIKKDNIVNNCSKLISTIKLLLNDQDFTAIDNYRELKIKYVDKIDQLIKYIEVEAPTVEIEPKLIKPKLKRDEFIDVSTVNAPVEIDIYKPQRQKPTIKSKVGEKVKTIKVYSLVIDNDIYYLDCSTCIIYNADGLQIGTLNDKNVVINGIVYNLQPYDKDDYRKYQKLTKNHIIWGTACPPDNILLIDRLQSH